MFTKLKFPLLYLVQALLWIPFLASFCAINAFFGTPVAELSLDGKSLPAGWEAAIYSHGQYLQGFLISEHPIAFALTIIVLVGSVFLLHKVQKAKSVQREAGGPSMALAHTIAHFCVGAIIIGAFYLLVFHVLVGVDPK